MAEPVPGTPRTETPATADLRLSAIVGQMTIGDWAKLVSVVVVLAGGAASVGAFLEGLKRDDAIQQAVSKARAPLDQDIAALKSDLAEATERAERLASANAAMENQVSMLAARFDTDASFATFAETYIAYLAGGGPVAADILADYVCALYRDSQTAGKEVAFAPASVEALVKGDWDLSLDQLQDSGFNPALVAELRELQQGRVTRIMPHLSEMLGRRVGPQVSRRPGPPPENPTPEQAASARRHADRLIDTVVDKADREIGQMIKTVTYPGHPPMDLPPEIAARVHANPECRIR